ncbi:MAG: tetratricopeptide repeat protein [Calditrichaeota bacterium]|nr:MAG: tetratricopeptide repeat protein [Calditrichota bacterium]
MNAEIGLNSDLEVAKRKLHLQTSYSPEAHQASVTIFEGGLFLNRRDFGIDDSNHEGDLEHKVRQCHDLVRADIELLFHMAESVRASKHPPSIKHLGHLFLEKGFIEEAVEEFETVKRIDGVELDIDLELARAYYKKGDYDAAMALLKVMAEKRPTYPDVQLLLGRSLWQLKQYAQARQHFQKALQLNEKYWDAHYSLAVCLVESTIDDKVNSELPPPIERLKEAEQLFRKAGRLSSDLDHELLEIGLERMKLALNVEEALTCFQQARKEETTSRLFDSEFYLKFMFGQLDDNCRTLDYYISTLAGVVNENPDYADLRHSLGIAYLLKGWQCFSRATREFEHAVQINPEYEKAKKKLKLMQNDGRGLLILLRAVLN